MVDDVVEQIWCINASLSHSTLDRELDGLLEANVYTAFGLAVHSLKDSRDLTGVSKISEDLRKGWEIHRIEGSLKIQESDIHISVLEEFLDLLKDETEAEIWSVVKLFGMKSAGWGRLLLLMTEIAWERGM